MTKILLAHAGKQHSYQVAAALHRLGHLYEFHTSFYITQSWLQNYLIEQANTFWTRRFIADLPSNKVHSNWDLEIPEILYGKLFGINAFRRELVYKRDDAFDRRLALKIPKLEFDYYWGFQGSCSQCVQVANEIGRVTICELATAHVTAAKQILREEQRLHPKWAHTIDNVDFPNAYEKRLREEPHQAKIVIAASRFTKNTLLQDGIDESKIQYLPLGFDLKHIPKPVFTSSARQKKLRLLYAGRITQRKGIKYLLDAMRFLKGQPVDLHIIGNINGAEDNLSEYKNLFTYHNPVAQTVLFQRYAEYDALILPTVFEGFGLVIVEAMAAGLPVITTPNSIGPDIIVEDQNGYLVQIRSVESIVDKVETLLSKSPDQLRAMKNAARRSALDYSWNAYERRLDLLINQRFSTRND